MKGKYDNKFMILSYKNTMEYDDLHLALMVSKQIRNLAWLSREESVIIKQFIPVALVRVEECFKNIVLPHYKNSNNTQFDILRVDQYVVFLYFLENTLYMYDKQYKSLADRIYMVIRAISGVDLWYGTIMPKIWMFDHGTGSVLGPASYGNYFYFMHGCTVGRNRGGDFPKLKIIV